MGRFMASLQALSSGFTLLVLSGNRHRQVFAECEFFIILNALSAYQSTRHVYKGTQRTGSSGFLP